MKVVLQRVSNACVRADGETAGSCGKGLMMLVGVSTGDAEADAEALARKILNLRIFTDENGKMNLSVKDIGGEALVISNFTLMADYRHGNRPDFMASARPDEAKRLYEYFTSLIARELSHVGTGRFGAHMDITMCADGPVTIVLDSSILLKKQPLPPEISEKRRSE